MLAISFDEYCRIDAVNWSKLKRLWVGSPLHYKYHLESGEDDDSVGRALGRECHRLVLEPDSPPDYVIWEGGDRRGKAWKEFEAEHNGKTIFKPGEVSSVYKQAEAILKHPVARSYLEGAEFEKTIQWQHRHTKLNCKGRLDAYKPSVIIDLKGTPTINPREFARTCAKMGYHLQLAHYEDGVNATAETPVAKLVIIAAEVKAPFDVGVFVIPGDPMSIAREEREYCMETLANCIRTGIWPGTCPKEEELAFPAYIYGDGGEAIISGGHNG